MERGEKVEEEEEEEERNFDCPEKAFCSTLAITDRLTRPTG